jgi:hypothetical protein
VVLGAESPVNVWEHGLLFKVFCAEYTAAYFLVSPSADVGSREKRGLSAFSTFLNKKHGDFFVSPVKIAGKLLGLFLPLRLSEVKRQVVPNVLWC